MRLRHHRRLGAAIAVTTILALVTGCGDDGATDSNAGSEGGDSTASNAAAEFAEQPTELPVTEPVSQDIPTGLDVVFIGAGFRQTQLIESGLKAAAEELGWSVQTMTYDATNPATIATTVESALAAAPDAIALNGLLLPDIEAQIPAAIEAGIPLIPVATPIEPQEGVYPVLNTNGDNHYAGEILAATVAADAAAAGETAHVLQITVPAVAVYLEPQDEGFESGLSEACSDCTRDLINIELPDVFNGNYTQQVVSELQRNPDINYVVSDSGDLANGLDGALQQAGMTQIKRYGISPSNVQLEELASGAPGAWVVQPYEVYGWITADQVARAIVGDPTTLWDDAEDRLAYVVTADNVDEVDVDSPQFPEGYEDMFRELWGK